MEKSGESNIHIHNVSKKRRRFIKVFIQKKYSKQISNYFLKIISTAFISKDMFTTMVDMRWRYTLLSFTARCRVKK